MHLTVLIEAEVIDVLIQESRQDIIKILSLFQGKAVELHIDERSILQRDAGYVADAMDYRLIWIRWITDLIVIPVVLKDYILISDSRYIRIIIQLRIDLLVQLLRIVHDLKLQISKIHRLCGYGSIRPYDSSKEDRSIAIHDLGIQEP